MPLNQPGLCPRVRAAFALLGVTPGAEASVLRHAWKTMARAHHPDRGGSDRAATNRRLAEINDALDTALAWTRAQRPVTEHPLPPQSRRPLPPVPGPQPAERAQAPVRPPAQAPVQTLPNGPGGWATGPAPTASAAAQACFLEARRIFAAPRRLRCLGVC
ncbi:MAG: DnaJ domain [Pseudomonadota bacterium]